MLTKQPSEEYKNLCNSLKGKFFEVSFKTTSSQVTLYRCFPFFCSPDDVREKVLLEDPSLVDIQVNSGYRLASFSLTIVALLSSLIF